jgi:hypothetical protein
MRTATLVICAMLVGALMGAWIVHLSERNWLDDLAAELTTAESTRVELGKRFNQCLAEKVDMLQQLNAGKAAAKDLPDLPPGYTLDPPLPPQR